MNKTELIRQTAVRTGLSAKDTEQTLNALLEVIEEALAGGDKIQLTGFGVFETKERPARTARNPKTMEPVDIPAGRSVAFRPGKGLKEAVGR